MTDFLILEELQKIIKDIPKPRLLHKKGVTLKGFFRPYMSMREYTKASIFNDQEIITPVEVRFSSMLGDKGTADTRRNIKGMAVKFTSSEGIYDMICHNIPVNIVNDKEKIIDMFKVFHNKYHFDGINSEALWKYTISNPEALTFVLMLYSGIGIVDDYVNINYYAVNKCVWNNDIGENRLIRYKWIPMSSNQTGNHKINKNMTGNMAEFIAGFDPDRASNGIINSVKNNEYPMYELHIQMTGKLKVPNMKYVDGTVMWNEKDYPFMCIGVMVLDQIADTSDNENICFFPGNAIDGVEAVKDPLTEIFDFIAKTEAMERGAYT